MAIDRALVGLVSKPVVYEVDKSHIRHFAQAVGDPNPLYHDEAAARAAGYPSLVAPPTFATVFRAGADLREKMNLDWKRILHGEMEFRYHGVVCAGDTITAQARVADVYSKEGKSGGMDFLVTEIDCTNQKGEKVLTARSVTVIRRPKEGA